VGNLLTQSLAYPTAPPLTTPRATSSGRPLLDESAIEGFLVGLPSTIQRGRSSRVHLDDNWKLSADTPKGNLVNLPDVQLGGWRAKPRNNST
jgi:hypothetical protein